MAALTRASLAALTRALRRLVDGVVTDSDHVDRDLMVRLDAGRGLLESGRNQIGPVERSVAEQPLPQLPFLMPGQHRHPGRVVTALDQGQGLEHGVVEMGRHLGSLLLADPLGALGAEISGQAGHPWPEGDQDPEQRECRPRAAPGPTSSRGPMLEERMARPPMTSPIPIKQPPPPGLFALGVEEGGNRVRHVPPGEGGQPEGQGRHREHQDIGRPPTELRRGGASGRRRRLPARWPARLDRHRLDILDPVDGRQPEPEIDQGSQAPDRAQADECSADERVGHTDRIGEAAGDTGEPSVGAPTTEFERSVVPAQGNDGGPGRQPQSGTTLRISGSCSGEYPIE